MAATAIDGPITEALLKPHREKHLDVTRAEPAVFIAGGQIHQRKYRNLRPPTLTVLLDEPILKANRRVAVPKLHRAVGRTVEDRKSTCLNSSHLGISYAVFCLK